MNNSLLQRISRFLFPQFCPICGERLNHNEESLCTVCFFHLPKTYQALSPFDNHMARLFWGLFPIEKAAAFFYFTSHSPSANIIYKIKYKKGRNSAARFAQMIANTQDFAHFFDEIDAFVPVPLSKERQLSRGYNQSLSIAEGLAKVAKKPVFTDVLRRNSFIVSQTQLNYWQRQENVANAFELTNAAKIEGKHLMIVDDVMTTGATIHACAKQLLRGKDVKISVFTLAFAYDGV